MKKAPMGNPDDDRESLREDYLRRLEDQLSDVERNEILEGMSSEDLKELGFIGHKEIRIDLARHSETTEKENLVLESGVEVTRLPDNAVYENQTIEEFDFLPDVGKRRVIATRFSGETVPFHAGTNVLKRMTKDKEIYVAAVKGKVLIIKDTMHVLPSDVDCTIRIRISADKMRATMDCVAGRGDGQRLDVDWVMDQLGEAGIRHGCLIENIEEAVDKANNTLIPQADVLVAQGTLPLPGCDAAVEYAFDPKGGTRDFTILPDGRIDYRNTSIIQLVGKGDLLARLGTPQEGTPGKSILGQPVPAVAGREAILVPGKGVSCSEDGKVFHAEISGCVVLNEPVIEVMDVYVVNGNVDYSVGNIRFNGNVVINGNVEEGFSVWADGDIIVTQNVEPSRLTAGRDVRVLGGIQGYGKGEVSAGRNIHAEYAQNARLEAQGNIYIYDFSVNSHIFASRRFVLKEKHGSAVGGEISGQLGVDVKTLGSPSGTRTQATAGTDFLVRKKLNEIEKAIQFTRENIQKIDAALRPVWELMKAKPEQANRKKAIVHKTLQKRKDLEGTSKVMEAKRDLLYERVNAKEVSFVKVSGICYPDVYIRIRDARMHVRTQRENVRFYEDRKNGEIKTGSY